MEKILFEFRIQYETQLGEELYIFGNIDKFGNWKERKFKLEWTDGHIWKKEFEMDKNDKNIQYKYVVAKENELKWENRPNRILDANNVSDLQKENGKYILDQKWGATTINFNLNYHLYSNESIMMVKGNTSFLGEWGKNTDFEKRKMKLDINNEQKINDIWKLKIDIELNNDSKEIDLEYKYLIYNNKNKSEKLEQGDNRHVKILFTKDNISDETKFFLFANQKEYKLEKNSIITIFDSNFSDI
jgi:hypothetical protein